jgi:hypothetical protein
MARVVYEKRSDEDNERAARKGGVYDSFISTDFKMFKPKEGENIVRLMPKSWPKEDNERWGKYWSIAVYVHYNVGPDEAAYLCLAKMKGERCPVCDVRNATTDVEERNELRISEVHLAWGD